MTTYKDAGVDIDLKDECSRVAYEAAKRTFPNRKGKIGEPVILDGGFSGAIDMGDYYLVQNDDGVGTKSAIAHALKKYDTLGFDLVAMVVDDGICLGAEMMTVSNTIDIDKIDKELIAGLMAGLERAAKAAGVIVPGGEIAILGDHVKGFTWNATATGVVKRDRLLTSEKVVAGDCVIGLKSAGFRSNGLSLVRKVLTDSLGPDWVHQEYAPDVTWGEKTLTPSLIYCSALNKLTGGFNGTPQVDVHALAHITGGGIPGNIVRVLKRNGLGVRLDQLPKAHESMLTLQELGNVADEEAYVTWNMGIGMTVIAPVSEEQSIISLLKKDGFEATVIGTVTNKPGVELISQGHFNTGKTLVFEV